MRFLQAGMPAFPAGSPCTLCLASPLCSHWQDLTGDMDMLIDLILALMTYQVDFQTKVCPPNDATHLLARGMRIIPTRPPSPRRGGLGDDTQVRYLGVCAK